jgi:hypothetical protein
MMNFKDLIRESYIITEGRKEDAREKYPNIPENIFNLFVDTDPSGNQKYLMWLCKVWSNRGLWSQGNEAAANKLLRNLQFFHEKPHKYEIKDINQFVSIGQFNADTEDARTKLTKGELKKQSNKLYETDRYLIVEPTSHASSCYYGSGTRWCTTMKSTAQYFNDYRKRNSLFYFINKKNGKKRAFLTPFSTPMFGDSFESHAGTIYTERDNVGHSMTGIPVEGRRAMNERHKQLALKNDPSIRNKLLHGEKVLTRIVNGDLDLSNIQSPPNSMKEVRGNLTTNSKTLTLNRIKRVRGNVYTSGNLNLGDLTYVSGDLKINHGINSLNKVEYIGGDLTSASYWGSNNLNDLGNLKEVRGTFYLNDFPNLPMEELSKLDKIGTIKLGEERYGELISGVRLPNLPQTAISVRS